MTHVHVPTAQPIVRLEQVGYVYDSGRRGVDGVDLDVRAGDVVAIIGPNGAGKSTLLGLLTGALVPSSGRVAVLGRPAHRLRGAGRARLGVGVDEPAHADELTGRENALLFARAHGLGAREAAARVDAIFATFGLSGDAHVACGAWSFGMRRRLQLSEALAHDPALVLLDEPTIGLDTAGLAALRELLAARARAGTAIVVATNDLHGLIPVATRIVFLHEGRKVADDAPDALLARVRGATRIDVTLDTVPDGIVFPIGTTAVLRPDGCEIRTPDGTATLPAICAALVEAGARIRALRVREPDLTDVFRDLTGADLAPAAGSPPAAAKTPRRRRP